MPSIIVQKVVPELIEKGAFEHPYIGCSGGTLNTEVAKAMNLPDTTRWRAGGGRALSGQPGGEGLGGRAATKTLKSTASR